MRYLFVFIIHTALLFAGVESENEYEKGLTYYKAKDYEKAYQEFSKALYKDFSNQEINFYIGKSAYELGLYQEALLAYERVIILNNNHIRAHYELARISMLLHMDSRAKTELEIVLQTDPPQNVKDNIYELLKVLEQRKQNSFWNYALSLGIGYDDNVNANPGEDTLKDYISTTFNLSRSALSVQKPVATRYAQELFNVRNLYKFQDNGLFLENSFLFYMQQFDDYSQYNLAYLSLTSAPGKIYKGYKFSLPLNISRVYYGSNSLFDLKSMQFKLEKNFHKKV